MRIASATRELRLQIHVQGGVSQGRNVHQRHVAVGRVQRQGQVHGGGGGAAAALGIDYGKDFSPRPFPVNFPLRRGQPDEGFEQVGGGGGTLDEFARAGAHGAHDDLGLGHAAHRKDGGVPHFLMDQFDGPQRQGVIVRGHIHQHDLRAGALHPAQDRVGDHHRITGAGVHHARHAGAVHQHLQHGTLLAILGDDYDGKFGHRISGPLLVLSPTFYVPEL